MRVKKGATPVSEISLLNLIATLAVLVVIPALVIWALKGHIPGAIWWWLPPLYVLWLLHLFNPNGHLEPDGNVVEVKPTPARKPIHRAPQNWAPPALAQAQPAVPTSTDPSPHWAEIIGQGHAGIEACISRGDWDGARAALQKVAYGMVTAKEEDKAVFTAYMKEFSTRDPLYRAVMAKALPLIIESPGMKQTQFYPLFPSIPPETIRYVFYYADQLGEIQRQKKGNSYLIFPLAYAA
jgi:hypothetical protein